MIVSEFLEKCNYSLSALDGDAPTVGSDDGSYWIDTLNRKKDELYRDPKNWSFIFESSKPNEIGTVASAGTTTLTGTGTKFTDYKAGDKITVSGETERTIDVISSDTSLTVTVAFSNTASALTFTHKPIIATGVQTYSLHRNFLSPSDTIYVLKTTGIRSYVALIKPNERDDINQSVYISGLNPQSLTFTAEIEATHDIVGGELVVPGYYLPADVSAETDALPIPDPNWAVAAVAAEIAFNDITYEDKSEGLNSRANYLYTLMSKTNRKGTYGEPRITPYNVKRITDTRR